MCDSIPTGCTEVNACRIRDDIPAQGKRYTRGVTKPQFERLLAFLFLNLTSEEMKVSSLRESYAV